MVHRPRLSQERLEQVLDATPVVVYAAALDQQGLRPVWVCPNVERILGHSVEHTLEPQWWTDNVHPDDRSAVAEGRLQALERGRTTLQYRVLDAAHEYRWVQDDLRLLDDVASDGINVVGSWTDVTERVRLETDLGHVQKVDAMGRLAAGFAHDFNNLVSVILAQCDAAKAAARRGGALRTHFEEITRSARRAGDLAQRLLALGRKENISPERIDANDVVRGQTRLLEWLGGSELEVDVRTRANPSHLHVDRARLEQALINLAINACDAMPEGGTLHVETDNVQGDTGDSYVAIRVTDTGKGIDPQTRAHIFEPFFTTKDSGQGTGLGLSMVYRFALKNAGTVHVESTPGHGSTFCLVLPVASE